MSKNMPSATEVVAERIQTESIPGERNDPYVVCAILQGGAQRASITAGAGVGFESILGDSEPFDESHNTSAGGFCWGALASRNAVECASIYYEELREDFISLKRGMRGQKIVDLSLLIDAVKEGEKAFDFDRLLSHPTTTSIYATSVADARKVRFSFGKYARDEIDYDGHYFRCESKEDVLTALEGSANLPFYAGDPVAFRELLLMDGGLTAGRIPLYEAIAEECTHILVVSTDKITDPELYRRKIMEKIAVIAIRRRYPYLASKYWIGLERHIEVLRFLKQVEDGEIATPRIDVIKTESPHIPSSIETDPQKLYIAARAGEEAVIETFRKYGLKRNKASRVRQPR